MTTPPPFEQGDVIVVFVPFPDQPAPGTRPRDALAYERDGLWGKDRPTVIVSVERHNRADDLLVALLTSQVEKARRRGEYVLKHWTAANLREESAIRPRLFQIVKRDVTARLGTIHSDDRPGMIGMLRDLLGL